jgi:hypothetical protein
MKTISVLLISPVSFPLLSYVLGYFISSSFPRAKFSRMVLVSQDLCYKNTFLTSSPNIEFKNRFALFEMEPDSLKSPPFRLYFPEYSNN